MTNINPWSYEYIRKTIEEATLLAKYDDLRPITSAEVVRTYKHSRRLNIPNLGDYVPEGWKRMDWMIEPVYVDITGRVRPGTGTQPISIAEFAKQVEQHTKGESSFVVGYGIIEMGQTQARIATYRKEENGTSKEAQS